MARLRTDSGHTLTLPPRRVSIGESAENEVPIAAGHGMAAVHFRLQPCETGHVLEDAGSGMGTLVNSMPVSRSMLKHGDVITAGNISLTYETEIETAEAPPAQDNEPVIPPLTAGPDKSAHPAVPREVPGEPPAWLPLEALQPPVPPWAQLVPQEPARSGTGRMLSFLLLILLGIAAAVWHFWLR
jgi:hypothetical protein